MPFAFDLVSRADSTISGLYKSTPFPVNLDTTIMQWNAATVDGMPEVIHSADYRAVYADQETDELTMFQNVTPAMATTGKVSRFKEDIDNTSTAASLPYGWVTDIITDMVLRFNGSGEIDKVDRYMTRRTFFRRTPSTTNGRSVGLTARIPPGAANDRLDEEGYGFGTSDRVLCVGGGMHLAPLTLSDSSLAHPTIARIAPEPGLFGLLSGNRRHRSAGGPDQFRLIGVRGTMTPVPTDESGNYWRTGETVELWSQCPSLPPTSPSSASRLGMLQPYWGLPPFVHCMGYAEWGRFPGDPAPVCEVQIYLDQQLVDGTIATTLVHSEVLPTHDVYLYGADYYGFGGRVIATDVGTMHPLCTGFRYWSQCLVDGTTGPSDDEPFKPYTGVANAGAFGIGWHTYHKRPPSMPWFGCSGQGNDEAGPIPGLLFQRYPLP